MVWHCGHDLHKLDWVGWAGVYTLPGLARGAGDGAGFPQQESRFLGGVGRVPIFLVQPGIFNPPTDK
jgi:hypothetical protein